MHQPYRIQDDDDWAPLPKTERPSYGRALVALFGTIALHAVLLSVAYAVFQPQKPLFRDVSVIRWQPDTSAEGEPRFRNLGGYERARIRAEP